MKKKIINQLEADFGNGGKKIINIRTSMLIENELDLMKFPLTYNIFDINNQLYMNLGSMDIRNDESSLAKFSTQFSEEEMKFPLLNKWIEIQLVCRTVEDEYLRFDFSLDAAYDFVKANKEKYIQMFFSFNDEKQIWLPLNSKALKAGTNYAYQWFTQQEIVAATDIDDCLTLNYFQSLF